MSRTLLRPVRKVGGGGALNRVTEAGESGNAPQRSRLSVLFMPLLATHTLWTPQWFDHDGLRRRVGDR